MILTTHRAKRLWKLALVCALASCASLLPARVAAARRARQTQTRTTPTSPSQPAKPAVKLSVLVLDEQKHAGAGAEAGRA
jgi:hypothetical protein